MTCKIEDGNPLSINRDKGYNRTGQPLGKCETRHELNLGLVGRNDDIQEFDSKWDGILLSMTKILHDDILEGLYK